MLSLVVPEDRIAGVCRALLDEKSREVLFSLQKGPLTSEKISEVLVISSNDAKDRLERLLEEKLVRKVSGAGNGPDLYALEFSMEIPDGCPQPELAEELYSALGESLYSFLEKNSDRISALCDAMGASLGRAVEQLFLSSISKLVQDLHSEMEDEDKRLSAHLGGARTT